MILADLINRQLYNLPTDFEINGLEEFMMWVQNKFYELNIVFSRETCVYNNISISEGWLEIVFIESNIGQHNDLRERLCAYLEDNYDIQREFEYIYIKSEYYHSQNDDDEPTNWYIRIKIEDN